MTDAGEFRFVRDVDVRFRDIDPMGHAHHSLPLVLFEEARAAYWRDVVKRRDLAGIDYILAAASIRYHARIRYPDRLRVGVRVTRIGRSSFHMAYEARSAAGELLATGETSQVMFDYAKNGSVPVPEEVRQRIRAHEPPGAVAG